MALPAALRRTMNSTFEFAPSMLDGQSIVHHGGVCSLAVANLADPGIAEEPKRPFVGEGDGMRTIAADPAIGRLKELNHGGHGLGFAEGGESELGVVRLTGFGFIGTDRGRHSSIGICHVYCKGKGSS